MTRQKKELIKRIDYLNEIIEVDMQLGCGMAHAGAYDDTYEEIGRLYDELAHLRGYADGTEMMYDTRGCDPAADPDIPFV